MIPNWLDIIVATLVVAGAFRGYRRGFVREGMALIGLIGGITAAGRWQGTASRLIEPFIGSGSLSDALAYVLIVLVALGCATVATLAIRKLMRLFLVDWLDAAGGGRFGAAQGAILAGLVLFMLVKFQLFGVEGAVQSSGLALVALSIVPGAVGLLPTEFGSIAHFFGIQN